MANAIPLLEGTDASGGYLVPDEVRETLVKKVNQESAIGQLVPAERAVGKRSRYPVYAGLPTVSVTGEGAAKSVTGAEYSQLVVNIKKFTALILYTEELLEDAREDPNVLIVPQLEKAFAKAIDAHALGYAAGAAITGQFDVELGSTTSTVDLGVGEDGLAKAVSSAMTIIEGNGGTPNGIILASDMRGHVRDARDGDGRPLYTNGFVNTQPYFYGNPLSYTSNLRGAEPDEDVVAGIVGDFTNCKFLVRSDLTMRVSTEATVVDGGTTHNLFQENKVGVLWEMRVGFNALDVNNQFVVIANPEVEDDGGDS